MLFEETRYSDYIFPAPQYLGAKYIHRDWIARFIPSEARTVLDAFAGTQSMAYVFKQLGKKVITNDFLNFSHHIGKALIENKGHTLHAEDVDILLAANQQPDTFNLIERLYSGLFFQREDAAFLDRVRSNVARLSNTYKQSLAMTVITRAMTRKVTMGHFAHTQALSYAANPARIKRNPCLIRPLKELFFELLPDYNRAVFDNGCDNVSYNRNILELLPTIHDIDLVYFDPPYCNSHADYQSFYHLLETYTEYWKDKEFVNGVKRYHPKKYSGFDKKREALANLEHLFELAHHIPHWLISYNDRSYPDIETMILLISRHRNVRIEKKMYHAGRGGKGSVAGSHEVLFVCSPRY